MYDFAVLKQEDEEVQITCPFNLGTIAQKKKKIEKFFETVRGASWNDGSIKISKEKMKSFFIESLNGITESLREILDKDFNIQFILLVGGYAESKILRGHINDQFGDQCKVLCPFRAQEAIVKGAVKFGRNPEVVASRKSAFTYGIATCEKFKSRHKAEKKFTADGQKKNAKYVDEWGVDDVGSFTVSMPDTRGGRTRKIRLEIRFGSTEITATATDVVSGAEGSIKIDFMTDATSEMQQIPLLLQDSLTN
ncbi:heat shock 70 kDa protein 12A-like protein [Lates japonicus]|uniref:Heat shock 70 kDa protein 12A-like protein n=1 Tax=Lates japonicus TaxID=270547 RepID=A0AAD3RHI8_LATJO|nr:heat shock 70 kDa protein 12A-like protein [Lates japonicus]